MAIGITAFDGGSEGTVFNSIAPDLQDFFGSLGFGIARSLELDFVLGLVVTIALVAAIYWGAIAGMGRRGLREPRRGAAGLALAHTLVPIAAAYVVAHYFSLLAYNGQDIWRLASDPLGDGSDRSGRLAASTTPPSRPRPSGTPRSARCCRPRRGAGTGARPRARDYGTPSATRSQIVMLLLMMCFTCSACSCCPRRTRDRVRPRRPLARLARVHRAAGVPGPA